jgi:serine/threonine protein phosphatase PrpC
MTCPICGVAIGADFAYCENCGAALAPSAASAGSPAEPERSARTHLLALHAEPDEPLAPACKTCSGAVSDDGWCTVCGARASNGREHITEQPTSAVAAVSDRGKVHPRNEDAFAVAARDGWVALIVCDGVTTTTDGDVAAFVAAKAARDLLAAGAGPTGGVDERQRYWYLRARAAARAADEAVESAAAPGDTNPPSCTFVVVIADADLIVSANVGDSRAYWLPDDGLAEQLSIDDSWASDQIKAGVPRERAEADPKAHAITKWLGIDSPPIEATVSSTTATGPGWLLACSDGLWNYCSDAAALRDLIERQPAEPLARAEALVEWANQQGGRDNITVSIARIGDKF